MNKSVAIYVRVSTEEQAKFGYSIAAQKSTLIDFCKKQNWLIYKIYADEGISGKSISKRPGMINLINDIKEQSIDTVLLYKFDRLTRSAKDTEEIISLLERYDVIIYTISGGLVDISSATGKFMVRINGAIAQLEREQTIERIKMAFQEKAKEGYSLCSKSASYGYNRKKGQKLLTINKKEALIVKKIYQLYLKNYSRLDIAKNLNDLKIKTKLGNKWSSKNIKLILTNKVYIGMIKYHNEYYKGFHKSIISLKTFELARQKLLKEKALKLTKKPYPDVLFGLVLYCGNCGHRMVVKRTIKKKCYISYRCSCHAPSISENKLEKIFISYLNQKKITTKKELSLVDKLKKQEIMEMYLKNELTKEEFRFLSKELIKKPKIKKELIFKNWFELKREQKRILITNYVSKIILNTIKNNKIELITFH